MEYEEKLRQMEFGDLIREKDRILVEDMKASNGQNEKYNAVIAEFNKRGRELKEGKITPAERIAIAGHLSYR